MKNVENIVNDLITSTCDANKISDGYHTIGELYEHRVVLFIVLCQFYIQGEISYEERLVWISQRHNNGCSDPNWFLMGIGKEQGEQIVYPVPFSYWDKCVCFAVELERAPKWDGHTSKDVLERLKKLYE